MDLKNASLIFVPYKTRAKANSKVCIHYSNYFLIVAPIHKHSVNLLDFSRAFGL